jgi:Tfp pilus assembly protein PilV
MKKMEAIVKNASGMTMVEVLLSMIIILVSALAVLMWQKTSWSQTTSTNRLMVAGQVVEKQIEKQRMTIAQDPANNFTAFKTAYLYTTHPNGVVITDSTVSPYMSVRWIDYDTLHDPQSNPISDVCRVKLTAWWPGAGKSDSLRVEARIAKNF